MAGIKLLELTSMRDFMVLSAVRVEREQRRFTRNPVITYLQTRHPAVTTYRIDLDEKIIGFVMLIHAENPVQWIIERLTIDRDFQRQGHGFAVADQLIDMIHDFENSEMVLARYNPENEAARLLFDKLGFVQREEMFRGRNIALLEFEFEADEDDEDDEDDFDDEDLDEEAASDDEEYLDEEAASVDDEDDFDDEDDDDDVSSDDDIEAPKATESGSE